jgi:hypothetical protein
MANRRPLAVLGAVSRKLPVVYRRGGVLVIDDLFSEKTLQSLYSSAVGRTSYEDDYPTYKAVNFAFDHNFDSGLFDALHTIKSAFSRFSLPFKRGWFFVYDHECAGVGVHADPVDLNMNLWVTPGRAMAADPDVNGLRIWTKRAPASWKHEEYNGNANREKVRKFLEPVTSIRVPYRCNRLTIFDSGYFHKTDSVKVIDKKFKRVNYTFLFGRERAQ